MGWVERQFSSFICYTLVFGNIVIVGGFCLRNKHMCSFLIVTYLFLKKEKIKNIKFGRVWINDLMRSCDILFKWSHFDLIPLKVERLLFRCHHICNIRERKKIGRISWKLKTLKLLDNIKLIWENTKNVPSIYATYNVHTFFFKYKKSDFIYPSYFILFTLY